MRIRLQRVHYVPAQLEPGILYVSDEFGTAAHLCACGCGSKVRTPIGPAEWSLEDGPHGATLEPSVGNWQRPCRSHYFIRDGRVVWAGSMTQEEVLVGRREEQERRDAYYVERQAGRRNILHRIASWIKRMFKRN